MKRLLILLFTAAAIAGCSKEAEISSSYAPKEVTFIASKIVESRALSIKSTWDGTEKVGVYIPNNSCYNLEYNVASDGAMSAESGDKIYYTSHTQANTFYAYYPFDSANPSSESVISVSAGSDILVATKSQVESQQAVALTFSHLLSFVEITVSPSSEVESLEGLEVYIESAPCNASYDLTSGEFSIDTENTAKISFDCTAADNDTYTAQALLLPMDYSEVYIYFKVEGKIVTQKMGCDLATATKYLGTAQIGSDE